MLLRASLVVVIVVGASHAQVVNKCTGLNGKVTYQDQPCGSDQAKSSVNLSGSGTGDSASEGSQYWQREAARQKRADRVQEAIANQRVFIGMTADEVRASWGAPSKINASVGSWGTHEQWVYDRSNFRSQYVYVENGVVRSMQSPQ